LAALTAPRGVKSDRLLAEESAAGPARDLFRYLGQEEFRHMLNLQYRYRELLSPRGSGG
jgi:hypothetical protein